MTLENARAMWANDIRDGDDAGMSLRPRREAESSSPLSMPLPTPPSGSGVDAAIETGSPPIGGRNESDPSTPKLFSGSDDGAGEGQGTGASPRPSSAGSGGGGYTTVAAGVRLPQPIEIALPGRPSASGSEDAALEIGETLGKGGMGVVYSARQFSLNRRVAVKFILPQREEKVSTRNKFIAEAVVTGALDHPNIVPIHDLGQRKDGTLFYTMKEVKGRSWREVMKKKTEAENLEILLRVCEAVAFAHDRGVLHRDLKPENVMVGDYGEVQVMDWGLAVGFTQAARGVAEMLSKGNARGGTPSYMAPEMAVGDASRMGPATDVYLLGGMLYEFATGLKPHHGDSVYACLYHAMKGEVQPTSRRGELVKIARKALSPDPGDRYSTVQEFLETLREYQTHRESIEMARQAGQLMREAGPGDYDRLSRALFGFEEATRLWDRNGAALRGAAESRVRYAREALAKGDYDLARALAEPLTPMALAGEVAESDLEGMARRTLLARNRLWEEASQEADELARKAEIFSKKRLGQTRRSHRLAMLAFCVCGAILIWGVNSWFRMAPLSERVRRTLYEKEEEAKRANNAEEALIQAEKKASAAELALKQADTKANEAEKKASAAELALKQAKERAETRAMVTEDAVQEAIRILQNECYPLRNAEVRLLTGRLTEMDGIEKVKTYIFMIPTYIRDIVMVSSDADRTRIKNKVDQIVRDLDRELRGLDSTAERAGGEILRDWRELRDIWSKHVYVANRVISISMQGKNLPLPTTPLPTTQTVNTTPNPSQPIRRSVNQHEGTFPLLDPSTTPMGIRVFDLNRAVWLFAAVGWGGAMRDHAAENEPLRIGGKRYEKGLYAHSPSIYQFALGGAWKRFKSGYGIQDGKNGSVVFAIQGDDKELFRSPLTKDHRLRHINIDVSGIQTLSLIVEDGGDDSRSDWGLWIEPQLER